MVVFHLIFLHEKGSRKPLGVSSNKDKIYFFPFFLYKDILGFFGIFIRYLIFFYTPRSFLEFQKFLEAKSLVTPNHIQPEWYFLPAYAVLRSIPNKLGGVLALVFFIIILRILPIIFKFNKKLKFRLRNLRFK